MKEHDQPWEHGCKQFTCATRRTTGPRKRFWVHLSLTSFMGCQPKGKHLYLEMISFWSFSVSFYPQNGVSYSFFITKFWPIPFLNDLKTGQWQLYSLPYTIQQLEVWSKAGTQTKEPRNHFNVERHLEWNKHSVLHVLESNYTYLKSSDFLFQWTPTLCRNMFPSSVLILSISCASTLSE